MHLIKSSVQVRCLMIAVFDGTINIDIPSNYIKRDITEISDEKIVAKTIFWDGPNGEILSIQKLFNTFKTIDEEMTSFRCSIGLVYGKVNNIGYYKREMRGSYQVMSEDELVNEGQHINCIIVLIKREKYNIVIYQMTILHLKDENKSSFL